MHVGEARTIVDSLGETVLAESASQPASLPYSGALVNQMSFRAKPLMQIFNVFDRRDVSCRKISRSLPNIFFRLYKAQVRFALMCVI